MRNSIGPVQISRVTLCELEVDTRKARANSIAVSCIFLRQHGRVLMLATVAKVEQLDVPIDIFHLRIQVCLFFS